MKRLSTGLLLLILSAGISAQTIHSPAICPLKIGDTMPDMLLKDIINYPGGTARFSDFKGKLVILDFWDKYCAACIRSFPELERLQDQYGDKIQILLVARNTMEELAPLFEDNLIVKETKLPIVINNRTLESLFPHAAVPYHVWIDRRSIVRASTIGASTTKSTIDLFLNSNLVNLPTRNDVLDSKFFDLSLLEQTAASNQWGDVEFYSLITKKNRATAKTYGGALQGEFEGQAGTFTINNDIISLFYKACQNYMGAFQAVFIDPLYPENIDKYYRPNDKGRHAQWFEDNYYCYELKLPKSYLSLSPEKLRRAIFQYMRADLERYFSIHAAVEKRMVKCIVFSKTRGIRGAERNSMNPISMVTKDSTVIIKNGNIEHLIATIREELLPNKKDKLSIPIINEVNYGGRIDMTFKLRSSLEELNRELDRYGVLIKEEMREIQCLILKEQN